MKRLYVVTLAALVAGFGAQGAEGAIYTHAKIALHLANPPAKNTQAFICQNESPVTLNIPCSAYVVDGATAASYSLYVVIAQADPADTAEALAAGTKGIALGISYNGASAAGVDVSGWTSCADLEFGNDWPNAGGGNVLTWVECQTHAVAPDGVHVVVGAFSIYAYSADQFSITQNLKLGVPALQVADCSGAQWDVSLANAAKVSFDSANPGCNPCLGPCIPIAVEPATWGKIKNLYNR
jgi:hypothetical protein